MSGREPDVSAPSRWARTPLGSPVQSRPLPDCPLSLLSRLGGYSADPLSVSRILLKGKRVWVNLEELDEPRQSIHIKLSAILTPTVPPAVGPNAAVEYMFPGLPPKTLRAQWELPLLEEVEAVSVLPNGSMIKYRPCEPCHKGVGLPSQSCKPSPLPH